MAKVKIELSSKYIIVNTRDIELLSLHGLFDIKDILRTQEQDMRTFGMTSMSSQLNKENK